MEKTELLVYINNKLTKLAEENMLFQPSTEEGRASISFIAGQVQILREVMALIK